MSPNSQDQAADRWAGQTGMRLASEVLARLITGRGLDDLGLGVVDGRSDLRGLPASGAELGGESEIVVFRDAALKDLDLRGARLSSWRLHDSSVIGCLFDDADCRDWRLWGSTVSSSRFSHGVLEGSAVGTWQDGRGNAWRTVDFVQADFRVGVSWSARYEGCDFSGADLADVRFEQCALVDCRFAGDLVKVVFDGRPVSGRPASPPMKNIDMSQARFSGVEFLGFDLQGVTLPDDPDLRVIRRFPCVVERALAAIRDDQTPEARVIRADLESRLPMLRNGTKPGDANVFNRRDWLPFGGERLASRAEEVLVRAESECLRA